MLEALRTPPLWMVLAAYGAIAATAGIVVRRMMRAWLRRALERSPSHLTETLANSLPRPVGVAVFLIAVDIGLRKLPMPQAIEAPARHFFPFCLEILVVVTGTRLARKAIDAYGRSNPALHSIAGLMRGITWAICLALVALLASDALGVSLAPALAALGVGSLAVALALQDTLSNFFSGFHLLVDKPVRPGEFIRLDSGHEGYVEAIGWRSTQLRTLAPSRVVVPNASLAKSVITNFGETNPRLALEVRFDVSADADAEAVERFLADEAKSAAQLPGARATPVPTARLVTPSVPYVLTFAVIVWVEASSDAPAVVQHLVRKKVLARLRRERVPMPMAAAPGSGSVKP